MGDVINLRDPLIWAEINLAKKSLAFYSNKKNNPNPEIFDWSDAIRKEKQILRSFYNSL
jgi:hypothetical protein